MHAAFFFGSSALYEALRDLRDDQIADIAMTAVSYTNSLLGDEALKCAQRRHARCINNAMVATLLGEIASGIRWRALVLRALRERRDA